MDYNYTSPNYTYTQQTSAMSPVVALFYIIVIVLIFTALWKVYTKAGQPGWACLIPFYNLYILLKIVGRPGWWIILYLIPIVNIVISLLIAIDLAKSFGRSTAFGVLGLWLFSLVGYLMLAFGSSKYIGPKGASSVSTSQPVAV